MNRVSAWLASLSLAWCGPAAMALSVFDVIEMTRNGYDEAAIERLIEVTNARFVVDVDSLLALGEADVADEIIALMLERGAEPPAQLSAADQLIALGEAGFSEETIMRFARHNHFCEPLADADERRLGQAGFSSAFVRNFDAQAKDCREDREAVALIEPLPEDAYREAPAPVTRVYQTNTTVYPSTARYPRTTNYAPYHYGIHDSYYYHDRFTRVYPIIVYRDYSGHKYRRYGGHRYGKSGYSHIRVGPRHGGADTRHGRRGHGERDQDRRRRSGDGWRSDSREDRDRSDAPRRKASDVRPRRPHPRSDSNPARLVSDKPTNSVIPPAGQQDNMRRGVPSRLADPVSTKPTKPLVRAVKRTDRSARQRPQKSPSDMRRRVERPAPAPKAPAWTTFRPGLSAPVRARTSEPGDRPPQRMQPPLRPSRVPSVASPPRTPRVAPPSRPPRAAPAPRSQQVVRPSRPQQVVTPQRSQQVVRPTRPARRSIDNDTDESREN